MSSRSATFRTSSSKPSAVSPIAFSTGPTSSSTRSRPARLTQLSTPERDVHPEARQVDRPIHQLHEPIHRTLLEHVRRVLPLRHRRDPQLQALAPRDLLRADHRVRPGPVRIERQHHRSVNPASIETCSGVIAVPMIATASSTPAWWSASTSV